MSASALGPAEQRMAHVVQALERDLDRIRVGGASASLIEGIHVDHHGRRTRLIDLASVTIPDPRQILIRPWDPDSLRAIGAAISQARIGLTPTIDGPAIRLYVPALTEDRRREVVELVRKRVERARVDVRAVRHDAIQAIRAAEAATGRDGTERDLAGLQRLVDRFAAMIDRLGRLKERRASGLGDLP